MESFLWFENTWLSIWVRESPLVFPTALVAHAIGMGTLVGVNVLIGLRALGVTPQLSGAMLVRFLPLMWAGFLASLFSGLLLLAAYPAKALTNPVFFLKFVLIALALVVGRRVLRRIAGQPVSIGSLRTVAIGALLLWAGAITAGRLLAYTHHVLLASHLY
jgi:hypothetical protein